MDKKLKKQWVEALRSGDYEQGTNVLCKLTATGAQYCCLGVLAEVVEGEDTWYAFNAEALATARGDVITYGHNLLPTGAIGDLASMNDDGKSFDYLANWIEENL